MTTIHKYNLLFTGDICKKHTITILRRDECATALIRWILVCQTRNLFLLCNIYIIQYVYVFVFGYVVIYLSSPSLNKDHQRWR